MRYARPGSQWEAFVLFATAQCESTDVDPVYPVLREAFDLMGLDDEQRWWWLFLFVAFYHLGSAHEVFTEYPRPCLVGPLTKATGVERRGFRGNALASEFINDAVRHAEQAGGFALWMEQARQGAIAGQGWSNLRYRIERLHHAGPWCSFKFADLAANVMGAPISAPDIGKTGSPLKGLIRLLEERGHVDPDPLNLDHQWELYRLARADGVPFAGMEEFETALCDYNGLCKGTYYVGHDIDAMMDQLWDTGAEPLWLARDRAIPDEFLGEQNGWAGVRRQLNALYRDNGLVFLGGPA